MAAPTVSFRAGEPEPGKIRLPRSSQRLQKPYVYCQLVTGVKRAAGSFWFEGPLCGPGDALPDTAAPPLIVLECAGPQSRGSGHRRPEILWILWRWTLGAHVGAHLGACWCECGRALAIGSEWTLSLGPLAEDLLRERIGPYDPRKRGREAADQAAALVEAHLQREPSDVRREAWLTLYGQIPGRIVQ